MEAESFFARWSKRNAEAAEEKQAAITVPTSVSQPVADAQPKPPPTIEDVATLTSDSDFTPFVARGVDENVRRSAMKKLFTDPHFNVMDGLDVYIEDYNKFDPIPPAMLAALNHAKGLLDPLSQLEHPLMRLLQTPPPTEEASAQAEPPEHKAVDNELASSDIDDDVDNTPDQASHDNPV
ncbi:DUF3306 domain-containing protein [Noviherbaspirillum sp. Root189]|uniref:DUF3306 domain-containing protein n=1 Tax=Noviherbaspirillum sp. Root189 TaxID=1736487 RepID=UPI00070CA497|nr:DUF3306 domain-containing protein [Noviherbaspirillum sp. Root189]KRB94037.1 hypothetical protein ASE07_00360 [Noviherbaspirillum sp. Root189]